VSLQRPRYTDYQRRLGECGPNRRVKTFMYLGFFGAARTVTGSKHLVEVNGMRILLDCGLFQGSRSETYERNLHFGFKDANGQEITPAQIDLMILSHAHIDHSGNIPNLVKQGFRGDIICTSATRDLCATMLPDSGHIQERDVEFVNKKRLKRGELPVEPIYTQQDAMKSLEYFITQGYHRTRRIAPGISLTFYDAGHMLGSAIVVLDIEDREGGGDIRLVFSGDLGRAGIPIIRDPEVIDGADILILESTYGSRLHEPYADSTKRLERIVNETYKRGGSIVMPAFAVGRTQQLVLTLHELSHAGDIPDMPIYVDSPLAVEATAVFRLHPEVFDDQLRAFMKLADTRDPFGLEGLRYIRRVEESKQLNFNLEPIIIISASGMAEFGRVLHHIKHRIEDPRNTILITGWQAPHTLGRRLVDGAETVRIFGEEYRNRAHTEVLNGFSGHADYEELLAWVNGMGKKPRRTFLVHGEEESAFALKQQLEGRFGLSVDVPVWGQSYIM
jgi:metallo-beta-lactamase family protein